MCVSSVCVLLMSEYLAAFQIPLCSSSQSAPFKHWLHWCLCLLILCSWVFLTNPTLTLLFKKKKKKKSVSVCGSKIILEPSFNGNLYIIMQTSACILTHMGMCDCHTAEVSVFCVWAYVNVGKPGCDVICRSAEGHYCVWSSMEGC